jgi:hypothetical protein
MVNVKKTAKAMSIESGINGIVTPLASGRREILERKRRLEINPTQQGAGGHHRGPFNIAFEITSIRKRQGPPCTINSSDSNR